MPRLVSREWSRPKLTNEIKAVMPDASRRHSYHPIHLRSKSNWDDQTFAKHDKQCQKNILMVLHRHHHQYRENTINIKCLKMETIRPRATPVTNSEEQEHDAHTVKTFVISCSYLPVRKYTEDRMCLCASEGKTCFMRSRAAIGFLNLLITI